MERTEQDVVLVVKPNSIGPFARRNALRKLARQIGVRLGDLQQAVDADRPDWERAWRCLRDLRGLAGVAEELLPPGEAF